MSNYNCSFQVIDSFAAFKDVFYLLMVGSGVGVRILKSDIEKTAAREDEYRDHPRILYAAA